MSQEFQQPSPPSLDRFRPLQLAVGYEFASQQLLQTAMTHRSAVGASGTERGDYERLEFLGDAVLGLVIAAFLIRANHQFSEGELSRMRAALVNEQTLAEVATDASLGSYLVLGHGESLAGGSTKASILADACEALIGAVFEDGGYQAAETVVLSLFGDRLTTDLQQYLTSDYKTMLQEYTQDVFKSQPVYEVAAQSGPDHAPRYEVKVSIGDRYEALGRGSSKKRASQMAARSILNALMKEREPSAAAHAEEVT